MILSSQNQPIVFTIFQRLQMFFATRVALKSEEYQWDTVPQFYLGNIQSRDVFRPISQERKYLMEYKKKIVPLHYKHKVSLILNQFSVIHLTEGSNISEYFDSEKKVSVYLLNKSSLEPPNLFSLQTPTARSTWTRQWLGKSQIHQCYPTSFPGPFPWLGTRLQCYHFLGQR